MFCSAKIHHQVVWGIARPRKEGADILQIYIYIYIYHIIQWYFVPNSQNLSTIMYQAGSTESHTQPAVLHLLSVFLAPE